MSFKIIALHHHDAGQIVSNSDFFRCIPKETLVANPHPRTGEPFTEDVISMKAVRVGIDTRRYVGADENSLTLIRSCLTELIAKYAMQEGDILDGVSHVFVATTSNQDAFPSLATQVSHICLLSEDVMSVDLSNACTGFLNALSLAHDMSEKITKVLIVAVDVMSAFKDVASPTTSLLFGDGVACVVLERSTDNSGILGTVNKTIPENNVACRLGNNGKMEFWMDGRDVYQRAVELIPDMIREYLQKSNLSIENFDYIVPHQANKEMLEEIFDIVSIPQAKVLYTIGEYGNTAAVSIPLTLSVHQKKFKKGDRILMFSIGAGMTLSLVDYLW